MPSINLVVKQNPSKSARCRQLDAIFDLPSGEAPPLTWKIEAPIEDRKWNVGAIIGPSGAGKSSILNRYFGAPVEYEWSDRSVFDDIADGRSAEDVVKAFGAVGFNTIPAWKRPFRVLSNGERFRTEMARCFVDDSRMAVIDEFTSVIDRQVAKIASNAVQKYFRRTSRQIVVASCHDDIVEWLQPDWIIWPADQSFEWRLVRRRPELRLRITRLKYDAWSLFSRFHYLTSDLHRVVKCYGAWANDKLVGFLAVIPKPHAVIKNVRGVSRVVTLPDWQGIGIGPRLVETIAGAYKALGYRFRNYPAHPNYVRVHKRSGNWLMIRKAGQQTPRSHSSRKRRVPNSYSKARPCACFEYVGPPIDRREAEQLVAA